MENGVRGFKHALNGTPEKENRGNSRKNNI